MDKKYTGMTVNERLYVSGLMDAFDKAIELRDDVEITRILREVELADKSIKPILDKIKMGF